MAAENQDEHLERLPYNGLFSKLENFEAGPLNNIRRINFRTRHDHYMPTHLCVSRDGDVIHYFVIKNFSYD